jgi:hypothetical protein
MKGDPNAEARKEFSELSELIEVLNILEKHESPKQASLNHLIATDYSVGFMHTNPFAA